MKEKSYWLSYFSLFTSIGTIFCCALPALLVSLGMGAAFAGFVSVFPQIVWLSKYKVVIFFISGALIAMTWLLLYLNRNAPCPIDPDKAKACKWSRSLSVYINTFATVVWCVGGFFAFFAVYILI